MTTTRRLGTLLALAATFTGLSTASVIAYTANFGPGTTDFSYVLTLPKFNPVLGLLNSVTLFFRGVETITNFTVANLSPESHDYAITATSNLVLGSTNTANNANRFTGETLQIFDTGAGSALGNCSDNPSSNVAPNNSCAPVTLASGQSINFAPFIVHNTDAIFGLPTGTGVLGVFGVVKAGTGLANYTGAGTFNLTGSTFAFTGFSGGGGNLGITQATSAVFAAEVDYDYTIAPTPEPATLLLLGTALIGLGAIGRKRLRRS